METHCYGCLVALADQVVLAPVAKTINYLEFLEFPDVPEELFGSAKLTPTQHLSLIL